MNFNKLGLIFLALLTLLFVGLKLTDNINWSWWWVLSPLLAVLAIKVYNLIFGD